MSIYCTYITFYRGNKLPPFYIGSTSVEKINNGYHGSVSSREYKQIWLLELKHNSHLFVTKILTTHDNRKDALLKELKFQTLTRAPTNTLYINKAYAGENFLHNVPHSKETKTKLSKLKLGKQSPLKGKRMIDVNPKWISPNLGRTMSIESRIKSSNSHKNLPNHVWTEDHKLNHLKAISGKNSNTARKINIYNNLNQIVFECHGNFLQICNDNNLPTRALQCSLHNNGKPIFTGKLKTGEPNKRAMKNFSYIGWYTIYAD